MKQIVIKTFRNGNLIKIETYFVNNCANILVDTIYDYLNTQNIINFLHNNKLDYKVEINDIKYENEFNLYHYFKLKIDENQNFINEYKQLLNKLQKVAERKMLEQWLNNE